jgi:dihydroorotate dehydrogenase (fumarate)
MTKEGDLSTTLAGIPLQSCLYNASGPRSGTAAALHKVAASANTGAVLTKSATLLAQTGNPQPRTHHSNDNDGGASFNSEGLPNNGIDYYLSAETMADVLGDVTTTASRATATTTTAKPYIVSLSGKTLADNLAMLERIAAVCVADTTTTTSPRHCIAAVELNLACPNVIGHPIIAYDVPQMKDILQHVQVTIRKYPHLPPLGVKLAPYLDFVQLATVATLLNEYTSVVKYVVAINTLGNALCIDTVARQPYICANDGYAGLSGAAVHYTALANVRKLRQWLDPRVDIVGVGGVATGAQAAAMLLAGATAVQIGTTHWREGPACFDRIASELRAYLQSQGCTSVAQLRAEGLRSWSKEGAAQSRAARKASETVTTASVAGSSCSPTSGHLLFFPLLSAVLAALVAFLLADKMQQQQS